MKNVYLTFVLKDYKILKISFMVLTSYLLIDEMRNFLVTKPTFTSVTQTKIKPDSFPNILICPEQAFDLNSLHSFGYRLSFYYGLGSISGDSLVTGWLGNQTEKNTTEVADKISSLKSLKDCPEIFGRFKINGKFRLKTTKLILELTRVLYPNGRCCRVIKPKEAEKNILSYMYLYVEYSNFTNYTTGFNLFLSDHKSASLIQPPKFVIDGPQFNTNSKQTGYKKYRIKLLEEIHLEEDPHFPCRNYEYDGEYNQCLEEEYTRQSLEVLNCTPPWMTDDQDIWCKQNVKGSSELSEKSRFLLGK